MGKTEKLAFFVTGLLLGLFLLLIFFSRHGIKDYRQLILKKASVSAQIDIVRQENRNIEDQILRLTRDIDYVRHLAKHEHGMAEPDELIFKQEK
jgi:cell division protein FtsB